MASRLNRMSLTLSLYLAKKFLTSIFLTLLVLGAVSMSIDYLEMTRRLSAKGIATSELALQLVALKTPDMLLQLAPFAILLGTLAAFARLTKGYELTAIRASGIPARTFLIPPMLVCLAVGLFNLAVLSPFSASTLKKFERLENEIFPGSAQGLVTEGGQIWLKQTLDDGEMMLFAKSVEDGGEVMEDATIFMFNPDGGFKERYDTPLVTLDSGTLHIDSTLYMQYGEPMASKENVNIKTDLSPQMIQNSFTSPQTLSVWKLPEFIEDLESAGFSSQQHKMHLHRLLSAPALALAMFLLAAPFALHYSRQRSAGFLMIGGICFGFIFYMFSNLISTYGLAGRIDLVLSAWMPAFIAALIGVSLFLHFREE